VRHAWVVTCLAVILVAVAETLQRHRLRQLEHRVAVGKLWDDHGLVVCTEDGRPIHPETFTRLFRSEARRLGLEPIGVHGLRHSMATSALAAGEDVKVVSQILGHSSTTTTRDRYQHPDDGQRREVASHIAEGVLG